MSLYHNKYVTFSLMIFYIKIYYLYSTKLGLIKDIINNPSIISKQELATCVNMISSFEYAILKVDSS